MAEAFNAAVGIGFIVFFRTVVVLAAWHDKPNRRPTFWDPFDAGNHWRGHLKLSLWLMGVGIAGHVVLALI